jgi:hypothetical protein
MAYCYEIGHFSYYQVDTGFINISIHQLFIAVIIVTVAIIASDATWAVAESIISKYDSRNAVHRTWLFIGLLTSVLIAFLVFVDTGIIGVHSKQLGYLICLAVYVVLLPLSYYRAIYHLFKGSGMRKALELTYQETDKVRAEADIAAREKSFAKLRVLPHLIIPLVSFTIAAFACGAWGYLTATYQDRYVTIVDNRSPVAQILVRENGDTIITKSFDTQKQKLLPGFSVEHVAGTTFARRVLSCTGTYRNEYAKKPNDVLRHCPPKPTGKETKSIKEKT